MNEEAKQIIAFLLKRSGRTSLPESEFYLTMSMDLQWCSPKIAKEFVSQALQSGLLSKKEDDLSPSFDTKTVEIPTGFHPDLSSLSLKDESPSSDDLFDAVCDCISKHTKKSKESIADEIREEAQTKKLHESVAALMVAKRYEIDIKPFLPQVKESMFTENTE
jgi:hypothetical protein